VTISELCRSKYVEFYDVRKPTIWKKIHWIPYVFQSYFMIIHKRILGRVWWELKDTCNLCNIMNSRYRVYLGREGNASKRRDVNKWIHVSVYLSARREWICIRYRQCLLNVITA